MACTFKVKDPKTGKEVDSKLFKELEEWYGDQSKAELAYRNLFSPRFISLWGDWTTDPELYKRKDENGKSKLDQYGEPIFTDVIELQADWELNRKDFNIKQFDTATSAAANRLQKIIESLTTRLQNLRRVKQTQHNRNKLKLQIEQIFDEIQNATEVKGYQVYVQNAVKEIGTIIRLLDRKGNDLTAHELQEIYYILDTYGDISQILKEATQMTGKRVPKGKKYALPEEFIETLKRLENDINTIEAIYKEKAVDFVSEKLLGNGEEWMANVKEFYRRSFLETPEGKRKKDENIQQHRLRVQKYVNQEMANNNMSNKADAKTYVKNLLAIGTDIGSIQRWALNASQTTSPMLRALNASILNVEDKAKLRFNDRASKLNKLYADYVVYQKQRGKGSGNPVEFFEFIAERTMDENGVLTEKQGSGYYVSRWHSEWYSHLAAIRQKLGELKRDSVLDEVGNIDKTKSPENYKLYHNLRKVYMQNSYYDNKSGTEYIGDAKNRLNKKWKRISEINKILKPALQEYNRLAGIDNATVAQLRKFKKLDEAIFKYKEEKAKVLAEAAMLEDSLQDELFKFEDTLLVPSNNLNKAAVRKYVEKHVGIKVRSAKEYLSEQYKEIERLRKEDPENPVYKYYQGIMSNLREADSLYGSEFKLRYRMVGKYKTIHERFTEDVHSLKDFWNLTKVWLSETFKYKEGKDMDSVVQMNQGEESNESQLQFTRDSLKRVVRTNSKGRQNQHIPIYYRQKLDLKDQSFNVHDNTLLALQVSYNYHYKNQLMPVLEMFMTLLADRQVVDSAGFQNFVKKTVVGEPKVTKDTESMTFKAARDLIEQRMFGQAIVESGVKIGDISVRKMWNLWLQYTGLTLLSGNWMTTISNRLLGGTLSSLEGLGAEFYTYGDLLMAEKDYGADLGYIMDDIGRPYPKSKTNLLGLIFDPMNEYRIGTHTYAYNNKFKALFNTSTLHGLNGLAEHNMHNLIMYSILRSVKVLGADGNYLNKDGSGSTTNVKEAMSLAQAYRRVKNGENAYKVEVNPDVKGVQVRSGETLTNYKFTGKFNPDINIRNKEEGENAEAIMHITRLIQATNEDLHGSYSERNSAPGQRHWWGQALWSMRKFFPSSLRRRLQGLPKALFNLGRDINDRTNSAFFQDAEDQGDTSTMQYDPRTKTMREGMYVTTLKYLSYMGYHGWKKIAQMFTRLRDDSYQAKKGFMAMSKDEWTKMSEHQKANIRRTIGELTVAALAYQISMLLKERGEDDDDYWYYHGAFFAARLNTELRAYSSLRELYRLMLSPATTTTMLERLAKVYSQLVDDVWNGEFEEYQSGLRKGDTKLGKAVKDVVPFWKHTERWKFVPDILNYHYRD